MRQVSAAAPPSLKVKGIIILGHFLVSKLTMSLSSVWSVMAVRHEPPTKFALLSRIGATDSEDCLYTI